MQSNVTGGHYGSFRLLCCLLMRLFRQVSLFTTVLPCRLLKNFAGTRIFCNRIAAAKTRATPKPLSFLPFSYSSVSKFVTNSSSANYSSVIPPSLHRALPVSSRSSASSGDYLFPIIGIAFRMLLSAFNNAGWCGESQKGFRCTTLMREV